MKKIMAMFLCAVMVCSLMPTAFAGEDASEGARDDGYIFEPEPNLTHEEIVEMLKNDPTTETCSEYDAILQEKAEATKVLASKSASASEKIGAKLVEQFDPTAEVYKLQEKTDKELHEMGYSADRIQIIRNFKGPLYYHQLDSLTSVFLQKFVFCLFYSVQLCVFCAVFTCARFFYS